MTFHDVTQVEIDDLSVPLCTNGRSSSDGELNRHGSVEKFEKPVCCAVTVDYASTNDLANLNPLFVRPSNRCTEKDNVFDYALNGGQINIVNKNLPRKFSFLLIARRQWKMTLAPREKPIKVTGRFP